MINETQLIAVISTTNIFAVQALFVLKNKQSCAFISLQLTEEGPNEVRQKTNCGKNFIDHSVQDVNLSSGQRNLITT